MENLTLTTTKFLSDGYEKKDIGNLSYGVNMGTIAINMFSKDVNSLDDSRVQEFKSLLENMADAYKTKLNSFAIHKGKVIFNVNSEEMCSALLEDFGTLTGQETEVALDSEDFVKKYEENFDKPI